MQNERLYDAMQTDWADGMMSIAECLALSRKMLASLDANSRNETGPRAAKLAVAAAHLETFIALIDQSETA